MTQQTSQPIKIDVYADIACPWCYIGKRRLEAALRERPEVEVELSWRPFQLRPEMPAEGVDWAEFVETKFGGAERAQAAFERVGEAGEPDGIRFRFDLMKRAPNTLDAHRLVLLASEQGREWKMANALFEAYFEQGLDINSRDVLVDLAAGVGLDGDEVARYLDSEANADVVQSSQEVAHQLGVNGVPFYVLNDRFGVSGAQPVELFVAALDRLSEQEIAA
jgi:predicted DsbA family dithiol-disulfide isomerase